MKPSIAISHAYAALATKQHKTKEEIDALSVLDTVTNDLDGDLDDLDEAYYEFLNDDDVDVEAEGEEIDRDDDIEDFKESATTKETD